MLCEPGQARLASTCGLALVGALLPVLRNRGSLIISTLIFILDLEPCQREITTDKIQRKNYRESSEIKACVSVQ